MYIEWLGTCCADCVRSKPCMSCVMGYSQRLEKWKKKFFFGCESWPCNCLVLELQKKKCEVYFNWKEYSGLCRQSKCAPCVALSTSLPPPCRQHWFLISLSLPFFSCGLVHLHSHCLHQVMIFCSLHRIVVLTYLFMLTLLRHHCCLVERGGAVLFCWMSCLSEQHALSLFMAVASVVHKSDI